MGYGGKNVEELGEKSKKLNLIALCEWFVSNVYSVFLIQKRQYMNSKGIYEK